MPQRPSRFRRRVQAIDKQSHKSLPNRLDPVAQAAVSVAKSPRYWTTNPSTSGFVPVLTASDAKERPEVLEMDANQMQELVAYTRSFYDLSHSPTRALRFWHRNGGNAAHGTHSSDEHLEMPHIKKSREKRGNSCVKASIKSLGSPRTRKRGLPVSRLTLTRTTTLDGLPSMDVRICPSGATRM